MPCVTQDVCSRDSQKRHCSCCSADACTGVVRPRMMDTLKASTTTPVCSAVPESLFPAAPLRLCCSAARFAKWTVAGSVLPPRPSAVEKSISLQVKAAENSLCIGSMLQHPFSHWRLEPLLPCLANVTTRCRAARCNIGDCSNTNYSVKTRS